MEVPTAVQKDFEIKVDGGSINVTFRQANMGDDMARAALFSERRTSREGNKVIELYNMDWLQLAATEVRLTIVDCDITKNKKKILKAGMNEADFMRAWKELPGDWADEIHRRCLEVNPDWDFGGAQEDETD